jgi:uncharacterized membrane protein YesL
MCPVFPPNAGLFLIREEIMAKVKRQNLRKNKTFISPFKNYWGKENYIFLGIGIVLLIIGYIVMGQGEWDNSLSLTLSPIILIIAYLVFFPLSIFYKKK